METSSTTLFLLIVVLAVVIGVFYIKRTATQSQESAELETVAQTLGWTKVTGEHISQTYYGEYNGHRVFVTSGGMTGGLRAPRILRRSLLIYMDTGLYNGMSTADIPLTLHDRVGSNAVLHGGVSITTGSVADLVMRAVWNETWNTLYLVGSPSLLTPEAFNKELELLYGITQQLQ